MAAPSQLVGQILGHYRILEQIGAGGMGVVYRAHDEQLDRDVALKSLPAGTIADEVARLRFRKAALALAKLNHPNVAMVFEFGSQSGTDFLVTEYISGITLDVKLASTQLPDAEVLAVGIQLAQGLAAAHEQGVVHRDLKPSNLRLTPDGRMKILDFGLARLIETEGELAQTASSTQSQEIRCRLPYMAPEQLRGEKTDARSDIWAAGTVLYEMATGQRPFPETKGPQLIDCILNKSPKLPTELNHKLSPGLGDVILRALDKRPERRYQSAQELRLDLERLSAGVRPAAASPRWSMFVLMMIVLAALIAGVLLWRSHQVRKLTEKDTIILTDFTNTTGDAVFDEALKQALSLQLAQSPFLNILPDQKVRDTLRLMGRSTGERLTPELARDLCQRAGSKVFLRAWIASLGRQYVIGLNAVNCQTGDSVAQEQVTAYDKEHVLKAIDEAASKLRKQLGESITTIQKLNTPLDQATTSSLEALKAFSLSTKITNERGDAEGIPFLKRAIELDPNFALAYSSLGLSYYNLGQGSLSVENIKKAFELRDRVSEREKLVISAYYAGIVNGDLLQEIQAFEMWEQTYPRDFAPHTNLGADYASLGQYEKSINEAHRSLALKPDNVFPYLNLAQSYLAFNHWDEARAALNQAVALKLDAWFLHVSLYQSAFLEGDAAAMRREVDWATGKPVAEHWVDALEADTASYFGQLEKARELSRLAFESAEREGAKDSAALWMVSRALREAEFGDQRRAHQDAEAALVLVDSKDIQMTAALALARAGSVAQAQALAQRLAKAHPSNTLLNYYWLPTIKAAIEIERGNPEGAAELLHAASAYELGSAPPLPQGTMYPVYMRGKAYLLARDGNSAAEEFRKILDHRGIVQNFPLGALARLGLARGYALEGDTPSARSAYQDFLALWKDADPDIPILIVTQYDRFLLDS